MLSPVDAAEHRAREDDDGFGKAYPIMSQPVHQVFARGSPGDAKDCPETAQTCLPTMGFDSLPRVTTSS
jgi:hypothetical protein